MASLGATQLTMAFAISLLVATGVNAAYTPSLDAARLGEDTSTAISEFQLAVTEGKWMRATEVFNRKGESNVSLSEVGMLGAECNPEYTKFSAFYSSPTYAADFVDAAISGEWSALERKPREELSVKGAVLQGVLMGSVSSLSQSIMSCTRGNFDESSAFVDRAWVLFSSRGGPIHLGEKRCPQFATCTSDEHDAGITLERPHGISAVNVAISAAFEAAQGAAKRGSCWKLQSVVKSTIIPQIFVPVIQGMLREAYEIVSPTRADGFVEVCEGWAFAAAVLPRIAACDARAGEIVKSNMDTISSDKTRMSDGFEGLLVAVEQTYACLGITCVDVGAMVDQYSGEYLWQPCVDGAPPRARADVIAGLLLPRSSGARAPYERISGYEPVSSVESLHSELSEAMLDISAAVDRGDWTTAALVFNTVGSASGASLRGAGSYFADVTSGAVTTAGLQPELDTFASYYSSDPRWWATFVDDALSKSDGPLKDLEAQVGTEDARDARGELATKGTALQGLLAGVVGALRTAIAECAAGRTSDARGAPHFVDVAWALFATEKGPIALGEKRCPQFDTCVEREEGGEYAAGVSSVNVRLLAAFSKSQRAAQAADCGLLQTVVEREILPLLYVPVVQGMLREAWEVASPDGADGFVEVCEGWAFAAAVLPRVAACSDTAGSIIRASMDTIASAIVSFPPKELNPYAVVAAVESVYSCMGVTCEDINAMVDLADDDGELNDGSFLWTPCVSGLPLRTPEGVAAGWSQGIIRTPTPTRAFPDEVSSNQPPPSSSGNVRGNEEWKTATIILAVACAVLLFAVALLAWRIMNKPYKAPAASNKFEGREHEGIAMI